MLAVSISQNTWVLDHLSLRTFVYWVGFWVHVIYSQLLRQWSSCDHSSCTCLCVRLWTYPCVFDKHQTRWQISLESDRSGATSEIRGPCNFHENELPQLLGPELFPHWENSCWRYVAHRCGRHLWASWPAAARSPWWSCISSNQARWWVAEEGEEKLPAMTGRIKRLRGAGWNPVEIGLCSAASVHVSCQFNKNISVSADCLVISSMWDLFNNCRWKVDRALSCLPVVCLP